MTGICCMVLLEREESVESWLAFVARFARGFDGNESNLLGDALPGTDEERGGRSGPPSMRSEPSCRAGSRVLAARACCGSSNSILPMLPCRGLPPLTDPGAPPRCRSRCCFFFSPCRRFIIMSRMRGKKLSRLDCEAS
jgi:hypothetical protein